MQQTSPQRNNAYESVLGACVRIQSIGGGDYARSAGSHRLSPPLSFLYRDFVDLLKYLRPKGPLFHVTVIFVHASSDKLQAYKISQQYCITFSLIAVTLFFSSFSFLRSCFWSPQRLFQRLHLTTNSGDLRARPSYL